MISHESAFMAGFNAIVDVALLQRLKKLFEIFEIPSHKWKRVREVQRVRLQRNKNKTARKTFHKIPLVI